MSQLTDFEQGRIIGRWEAGESTRDISGVLNHSQSQVTHAIKAFKIKLLLLPKKIQMN